MTSLTGRHGWQPSMPSMSDIMKILQKTSTQKDTEEVSINRDEVIRQRIAELEGELAQRKVYGADIYDEGTVLTWRKSYPQNEIGYNFAAIKGDGVWFVTGTGAANQVRLSWEKLISAHWMYGEIVAEVRVATAWKLVGTPDEPKIDTTKADGTTPA